MKRKLLASITLALSAGLVAPTSATAALPSSTTLTDGKDDVSTVNSNKTGSHPLDIYNLKAAKSGKYLAVTMTLDDLTAKNTGNFTTTNPDGSVSESVKSSFRAYVKLDRATYTFAQSMDNHVIVTRGAKWQPVDCGDRATVRFDLARDTVRMVIPMRCLGNPRIGTILQGSVTSRNLDPMRGDWIAGASQRFQLRP
jgi:hypothetical protein